MFSAFPSKPDIAQWDRHVRFVPISEVIALSGSKITRAMGWARPTYQPRLCRRIFRHACHYRLASRLAALAGTSCGQLRRPRRSDCGGWLNARIKARRIRSGSRNPGELRDAIDRLTGGLHPLARATFTSPGRPPVHVRLASCHVPANKSPSPCCPA